jgi:hypothetical protein
MDANTRELKTPTADGGRVLDPQITQITQISVCWGGVLFGVEKLGEW